MKKALLIIFILSIIFLAGCGVFDLGGWVWPEDDIEFMALVEELDTPQKISDYMIKNFEYELHDLWTPDPYTLWQIKEGDCNDFATFGQFMAYHNDIETYIVAIYYKGILIKHALAVYVEDEGLSFTDNQYYCNNDGFYFDSIREIVEYDNENLVIKEWRKYKVYDYWKDVVKVVYNPVH
ncbi:hypothetical protein ES705_40347 [subsurface metagenome]